mgnify:CR=1 FL=1
MFGGGGGMAGGGPQLVYSRRIGAAPRWRAPDGALYQEVPEAATILGAAKLTGRTADGWSVGVLEAVTAREIARYIDADGMERTAAVAPLANHFAGRAQRSFRDGQTVVGAIATAVHRRLDHPDLAARFRRAALAAGADFRHDWARRAWTLSGQFAASHIAGEPAVIAAAQRSSARYYQRPDAEHLEYDPAATALGGYAARLRLARAAGLHWRGHLELSATSPGFEINDLGFQRDADRIRTNGRIRYVENRPGPTFRNWEIEAGPEASWNFGGDRLGTQLSASVQGELLSYWSGEVSYSHHFEALDDRLTRGGPLAARPAGQRIFARFESDARRAWTLDGNLSWQRDRAGGGEWSAELGVGLRPARTWSLSFGPELSRERSPAQYLGTVADPYATETYGQRYLFADLEQTTLSLETRLNVTFQPGLTLEVYAQPFLASARFGRPKELRRPRTFLFDVYGEDKGTAACEDGACTVDPDGAGPAAPFSVELEDFNRRSLRGNAVLRWEWRPGSTLFFVWTQSREIEERYGDFRFTRDARALLRARPDNVFLLKFSYNFNL